MGERLRTTRARVRGLLRHGAQAAAHRLGFHVSRLPGTPDLYDATLRRYHNRHRGERCVIMGNGPSLNKTNLDLLAGETVIGQNKVYLLFDRIKFRPTYMVSYIPDVVRQCAETYAEMAIPLFVSREAYALVKQRTYATHFFGEPKRFLFSLDPVREICVGHTVTYVTLQLAFYMGFSRVLLVGVDHNFGYRGPKDTWTVVDSAHPERHFAPNYFPTGESWQSPNLDAAEAHYGLARAAFASDDREVVDCTVDGSLSVFRKSTLQAELAAP